MRRLADLQERGDRRTQPPRWAEAQSAAGRAAEGMLAFAAALEGMELEQARGAAIKALNGLSDSLAHFEVMDKASTAVAAAASALRGSKHDEHGGSGGGFGL